MLDIAAVYDGTGNTGLTSMTTAMTNENHNVTNAGIGPLKPDSSPMIVGYGAGVIATADAIKELKLLNQDMWDPVNYSDWKPAGTSLAFTTPFIRVPLFSKAARLVQYAQKAAAAVYGYVIDVYPEEGIKNGVNCIGGNYFGYFGKGPEGQRHAQRYSLTAGSAGGALTAGAWGTTVWSPTSLPNSGRYAILGASVSNLTTTTAHALIGFEHPDFKGFRPGFQAADLFAGGLTAAAYSGEQLILAYDGWQFVRFSELTGRPQCPVFHISDSSTALKVITATANADTPTVVLNLAYLGPG